MFGPAPFDFSPEITSKSPLFGNPDKLIFLRTFVLNLPENFNPVQTPPAPSAKKQKKYKFFCQNHRFQH
jgi:hypothetical protein